jgi:hypothetical protein
MKLEIGDWRFYYSPFTNFPFLIYPKGTGE